MSGIVVWKEYVYVWYVLGVVGVSGEDGVQVGDPLGSEILLLTLADHDGGMMISKMCHHILCVAHGVK